MLQLKRKNGEEIYINNGEIIIKCVQARGGQVSLAFTAPKHIDIQRKEIFLRKQEQES